jgi:hypothetical protein
LRTKRGVEIVENPLSNTDIPAVDCLESPNIPALIIVDSHDTPYMLAIADYMEEEEFSEGGRSGNAVPTDVHDYSGWGSGGSSEGWHSSQSSGDGAD